MNILTVYILSYNRPHLLRRSIQTILSQTIANSIRLEIYDNCSSFSIEDVIQDFQDFPISFVRQSKNLGSTGNFKSAFFATKTTPFFCIFHDDDLMHPSYCESATNYLNTNTSISWVAAQSYSSSVHVDSYENSNNQNYNFLPLTLPDLSKSIILSKIDFSFCSVVYRSSYISKLTEQIFDNLFFEYSILMDRPLLFQLIDSQVKCAITNSKLIYSYVHPSQDSKTGPVQFINIISLLQEYISLALTSPSCTYFDKTIFKLWLSYHLLTGYKRSTNSYINADSFKRFKIQKLFNVGTVYALYLKSCLYRVFLCLKKIKQLYLKFLKKTHSESA